MHCLISSWWYPLVSAYTYSYSILGGTLVQIQTCNLCQTKCYYIIVIIVIIYKTCIVCLDRSAHKSFALSSRRILNLAVVIVLIAWEWCFVMSVISSYFPLCQRHFTSKQKKLQWQNIFHLSTAKHLSFVLVLFDFILYMNFVFQLVFVDLFSLWCYEHWCSPNTCILWIDNVALKVV